MVHEVWCNVKKERNVKKGVRVDVGEAVDINAILYECSKISFKFV